MDQNKSKDSDETKIIDVSKIEYVTYQNEEKQLKDLVTLIEKDLSEPYSVYTYRYFINNWPELCFMAMYEGNCIGVIVSKLDMHRGSYRGYIAMIAVDKNFRKQKIGSALVTKSIEVMEKNGCEEVVLEAEIKNTGALSLYQNLGFAKDKRLYRYYMDGQDAVRLKLYLPTEADEETKHAISTLETLSKDTTISSPNK